MSDAISIERFLEEEGFDRPDSISLARRVLEEAALTRPGKTAIASEKLPRAREALASRLARVCGDEECRRLVGTRREREILIVAATRCEVCGGSNNRRSAAALAAAMRGRGLRRLLVVGGSPGAQQELAGLLGGRGIELRLVNAAEGTHTSRTARSGLDWADVIVVWGATPLPHKVSRLYTEGPLRGGRGPRIVRLAKRGVEALCREVLRGLQAQES